MNKLIGDLMETSGVGFGTSGVRGLVEQMSDELCYAYSAAFLQAVSSNGEKFGHVVLGHDLRPSSPAIARACATAITDAGLEIVYAGALPTPALGLYAAKTNSPAIVVTGSHIPFDRNGIKFYRAEGEITKADEGAIRNAVVTIPNQFEVIELPPLSREVGDDYTSRYPDYFGDQSLVGMRVAVYEHSSVARDLLHTTLDSMGAEVISLGRTDQFIPIDTEAVRPEDIEQAHLWVQENNFDALLSTDGDGDRPLIGDEKGKWFRGDDVGVLCAGYLQANIVVTPVNSNTSVEKCGWFEKVVRTRIGSPYVIEGMDTSAAEYKGVVGYEANGGFLLGSDIEREGRTLTALPTRDALLPMLALLCMAKEKGLLLSELPTTLPSRFTASDRIENFPTEQSHRLIGSLQKNHDQAAALLAPGSGTVAGVDLTDGLRVTFESGVIVHLRLSGNAPELRCYAEADTPERANVLCQSCLSRLKVSANIPG